MDYSVVHKQKDFVYFVSNPGYSNLLFKNGDFNKIHIFTFLRKSIYKIIYTYLYSHKYILQMCNILHIYYSSLYTLYILQPLHRTDRKANISLRGKNDKGVLHI